MRRLSYLITLLCFVVQAVAQSWQSPAPRAYSDETVVYATIQSNVVSDPMSDFMVAAFIDGECRAEATQPVVGADGSQFFILRVGGEQPADLGKPISFKAFHKPMWMTYDVIPQGTEILYTGESEGMPSHPIVLQLQRQEGEPVALESFFFDAGALAAGRTTRVQLTAVPENASFDAYSVQLAFSRPVQGQDPFARWTAADVQRVYGQPLCFDVTPTVPGSLQAQVTVGGAPVTLRMETGAPLTAVEVGMPLPAEEGWQWLSNPYGDVTPDNIFQLFAGANLVEARTQDALVYNDPIWGYFGTLMEGGIPQNTCYKLKMTATPPPTVMYGGHYVQGLGVLLDGEWTWTPCPYYYDRALDVALDPAQAGLPSGMVIVSKEDGSAEFDGTQWVGDLTLLRSGQGYMVYSPLDEPFTLLFTPEHQLPQGSDYAAARAIDDDSPWHYDARRFMNNTTIVAVLPGVEELSEHWSIGVFVGSECRGEGHYVGGHFFITAHTERGEQVSLRLCHNPSGRTVAIDGTITTGQTRIGSLREPLVLTSAEATVGMERREERGEMRDERRERREERGEMREESFDLTGRRVAVAGHRGIVLQRRADGTVRKVLAR